MEEDFKNCLTYEDIRKIAVSYGVKDTKVSVGMWAKLNGFTNKRKMTNGKTTIYYTKDAAPKIDKVEKRGLNAG